MAVDCQWIDGRWISASAVSVVPVKRVNDFTYIRTKTTHRNVVQLCVIMSLSTHNISQIHHKRSLHNRKVLGMFRGVDDKKNKPELWHGYLMNHAELN